MYWVYFLYSKTARNVYVGCTKNIEKRFAEHQKGLIESTKKRRPFVLIYSEKYNSLSLARRRENYFKSLYGYRKRKEIMKRYFENIKRRPIQNF